MSRDPRELFFRETPPNIALQRTVSPMGFLPLSLVVMRSNRAVSLAHLTSATLRLRTAALVRFPRL